MILWVYLHSLLRLEERKLAKEEKDNWSVRKKGVYISGLVTETLGKLDPEDSEEPVKVRHTDTTLFRCITLTWATLIYEEIRYYCVNADQCLSFIMSTFSKSIIPLNNCWGQLASAVCRECFPKCITSLPGRNVKSLQRSWLRLLSLGMHEFPLGKGKEKR